MQLGSSVSNGKAILRARRIRLASRAELADSSKLRLHAERNGAGGLRRIL